MSLVSSLKNSANEFFAQKPVVVCGKVALIGAACIAATYAFPIAVPFMLKYQLGSATVVTAIACVSIARKYFGQFSGNVPSKALAVAGAVGAAYFAPSAVSFIKENPQTALYSTVGILAANAALGGDITKMSGKELVENAPKALIAAGGAMVGTHVTIRFLPQMGNSLTHAIQSHPRSALAGAGALVVGPIVLNYLDPNCSSKALVGRTIVLSAVCMTGAQYMPLAMPLATNYPLVKTVTDLVNGGFTIPHGFKNLISNSNLNSTVVATGVVGGAVLLGLYLTTLDEDEAEMSDTDLSNDKTTIDSIDLSDNDDDDILEIPVRNHQPFKKSNVTSEDKSMLDDLDYFDDLINVHLNGISIIGNGVSTIWGMVFSHNSAVELPSEPSYF